MSPEKEIYFFNYNYDKGINWYQNFFDKAEREKIIGEFSPTYLSNRLVPQRMRKDVPTANLLVSLRNPVDQVFSRYHYMVTRQMYNRSFEEALKEKPFVVEDAFYHKHIKRYLEYFDRSQTLILIYEDLRTDALSFLQKIYSFLDIGDTYIPPNLGEVVHFTRRPKSRWLEATMVIVRILLGKMRLYSLVAILKKRGWDRKFKEFNTQKNNAFREIDSEIRSRLNDIFANDKEMLSALIGRDLSFWK